MPDTNTPNTNIILQTTNENNNTWGTKTNSNWSVNDLNMGGRLSIDVSGSSDVTINNTQAENVYHVITGVLTGNINYKIPNKGRFFFLNNGTTGAFTLTAIALGGTGIVIPQGHTIAVFVNPDTTALTKAFNFTLNTGSTTKVNDRQIFTTAGTATWTKPSGLITSAMTLVQIWGGGGSGAVGSSAGGGGGGSYKEAWFLTSSLGSTETVTVGAGGVANTWSGSNPTIQGNSGSLSSFGSWLTAYGGAGGGADTAGITNSTGGAAGGWFSNSTGQFNDIPTLGNGAEGYGGGSIAGLPFSSIGFYVGGGGGYTSGSTKSNGASSVFGGGGGGGGSRFMGSGAFFSLGGISMYGGGGGAGGESIISPVAGTQPSGGGGGSGNGASTGTSGKGGDGQVIVTIFNKMV